VSGYEAASAGGGCARRPLGAADAIFKRVGGGVYGRLAAGVPAPPAAREVSEILVAAVNSVLAAPVGQ
jgi:hypothetical protein